MLPHSQAQNGLLSNFDSRPEEANPFLKNLMDLSNHTSYIPSGMSMNFDDGKSLSPQYNAPNQFNPTSLIQPNQFNGYPSSPNLLSQLQQNGSPISTNLPMQYHNGGLASSPNMYSSRQMGGPANPQLLQYGQSPNSRLL